MTSTMNSQTAIGDPVSKTIPLSAPNSRTGQQGLGMRAGSGTSFPHGQRGNATRMTVAVGDTNLQATNGLSVPDVGSSSAPNFLPGHCPPGAPTGIAGQDSNSQATIELADSNKSVSSASNSPVDGQATADAQQARALSGGPNPAGDQVCLDAHHGNASGAQSATSQGSPASQSGPAGGAQLPTPDHPRPEGQRRNVRGGWLRDPVLGILADVLDDLEKVRIANENRVRQLTRTEDDEDGENRGHGLTLDNPMVKKLVTSVEALAQAEHDATLNLQRSMRTHPLGPWVKAQAGVGEKQAARLLATIGDPYWNDLHDRPRTVSELWAFCGYAVHAGHAQARRRGERSNWSADAKMRTYLIAVSCVKQSAERSKYRRVYDEGRAKYADALHPHDCKRCGPAGKPALAGSPLSAGHQHNRAIRLISKELLKDLWIASRDLYNAKEDDR